MEEHRKWLRKRQKREQRGTEKVFPQMDFNQLKLFEAWGQEIRILSTWNLSTKEYDFRTSLLVCIWAYWRDSCLILGTNHDLLRKKLRELL